VEVAEKEQYYDEEGGCHEILWLTDLLSHTDKASQGALQVKNILYIYI